MGNNSLSTLLLIVLLDSNSFSVRESAQQSLEQMEYSVIPQLILFEKNKSLSFEQQVRIRRLLNRQRSNLVDSMCGKDTPFLDGLPWNGMDGFYKPDEYNDIVIFYRDMARNVVNVQRLNTHSKPWPDDRLAAKLWFEDLFSSGKSLEELEKVLKVLRIRSKYYLSHQNMWPSD